MSQSGRGRKEDLQELFICRPLIIMSTSMISDLSRAKDLRDPFTLAQLDLLTRDDMLSLTRPAQRIMDEVIKLAPQSKIMDVCYQNFV